MKSLIASRTNCRGFTLVEVMVALAVVAVTLPALMMALHQQIDGTGYLRDKSLAHLVAANQLAEIRILTEATRALPEGDSSGVQELADRQWYWWRRSSETELENFYRIEISVASSEEQENEPLITLTAFLSGDLEVGALVNSGTGTGTDSE